MDSQNKSFEAALQRSNQLAVERNQLLGIQNALLAKKLEADGTSKAALQRLTENAKQTQQIAKDQAKTAVESLKSILNLGKISSKATIAAETQIKTTANLVSAVDASNRKLHTALELPMQNMIANMFNISSVMKQTKREMNVHFKRLNSAFSNMLFHPIKSVAKGISALTGIVASGFKFVLSGAATILKNTILAPVKAAFSAVKFFFKDTIVGKITLLALTVVGAFVFLKSFFNSDIYKVTAKLSNAIGEAVLGKERWESIKTFAKSVTIALSSILLGATAIKFAVSAMQLKTAWNNWRTSANAMRTTTATTTSVTNTATNSAANAAKSLTASQQKLLDKFDRGMHLSKTKRAEAIALKKSLEVGKSITTTATSTANTVANTAGRTVLSKIGSTALKGIPVIGALAGGALDFGMRKASGQDTTSAAIGAGGGLAGGLAGAAAGAAIGSIVPGVGTAIGGIIGGIAGSLMGGKLGDSLSSIINSDERKKIEDATSTAALETSKATIDIAKSTATVSSEVTGMKVVADKQRDISVEVAQQEAYSKRNDTDRLIEMANKQCTLAERGAKAQESLVAFENKKMIDRQNNNGAGYMSVPAYM